MPFTTDDFLSGDYDNYFRLLNQYSDSVDTYTPYRGSLLTESQLNYIVQTNPQLPYITSSWQSNVGANGISVVMNIPDNLTPVTKTRKTKIQNDTLDLIYNKYKWNDNVLKIVKLLVKHGNAVLTINKDGELVINSIFQYNVYWDSVNKIARYAYKVNNIEVKGMQNLRHGVDLWHFKDPVSNEYPISPSRIDAAFGYILLENKAVKLNTTQFAKGWFNNVLLQVDETVKKQLDDTTKDEEGRTFLSRWLDVIRDKFSGTEKAGKAGYIPGVNGAIEIGKSNKDAQFQEMLKDLTPERIAWAYSLTNSNMGAGSHLTENNALTFDDALYDKVGRHLERALEDCLNSFILSKIEGLRISQTFKVAYNAPEDKNRLLEVDSWRNDWINDILTLNEYRAIRNLQPIQGGDVTYSVWTTQKTLPVSETAFNYDMGKSHTLKKGTDVLSVATNNVQSIKPNTASFENKLSKAINKQLNQFIEAFTSKDNQIPTLTKIESHFAFNIMEKELKAIIESVVPMAKIPPTISEITTKYSVIILKGKENYNSLDQIIKDKINNLTQDQIKNSIPEITNKVFAELLENRIMPMIVEVFDVANLN
jgi:hypothetical protein